MAGFSYTVKKMPRMTMHVSIKMSRLLRFRLWLGCQFLRLAGAVMNCDVIFEKDDEQGIADGECNRAG